jgi:hypothetical protein
MAFPVATPPVSAPYTSGIQQLGPGAYPAGPTNFQPAMRTIVPHSVVVTQRPVMVVPAAAMPAPGSPEGKLLSGLLKDLFNRLRIYLNTLLRSGR